MGLIVIPDDSPPVLSTSAAYRLLAGAEVQLYTTRPATLKELTERIRDAEIVINIRASSRFTRDVLASSKPVRLISIWGTGTDNVDLVAARELGIRVTNTPGVSAVAVAEHTLALMLSVARQLVSIDQLVRQGEWPRGLVTQLHGKTLGLVGLGAVGRQAARLGKGIGMRVIAWTFNPNPQLAAELDLTLVSFEDVFRQSDVVSVHVRQSPESIGMINKTYLEMMKPTALLINTSRGAIVVERDLVDALENRRIGGAGLDVFEVEPLPSDNPLHRLRNVVLTPHSAGITLETTETGLTEAIQNIFNFLDGNATNLVV